MLGTIITGSLRATVITWQWIPDALGPAVLAAAAGPQLPNWACSARRRAGRGRQRYARMERIQQADALGDHGHELCDAKRAGRADRRCGQTCCPARNQIGEEADWQRVFLGRRTSAACRTPHGTGQRSHRPPGAGADGRDASLKSGDRDTSPGLADRSVGASATRPGRRRREPPGASDRVSRAGSDAEARGSFSPSSSFAADMPAAGSEEAGMHTADSVKQKASSACRMGSNVPLESSARAQAGGKPMLSTLTIFLRVDFRSRYPFAREIFRRQTGPFGECNREI